MQDKNSTQVMETSKQEPGDRYEWQKIREMGGALGYHYRITERKGDNRLGTCYSQFNADFIVKALNAYKGT